MISCTEFIPAYSELFAFLEARYGRNEVDRYWESLFAPEAERHAFGKHPLMRALEHEGIRGCYSYWSAALSEEAADFTLYLNEKRGYYMIDMHHCPSKGRLLEQKEQTGLEPYPDYCLHCDYYRLSAEKAGFEFVSDYTGVDHAACKLMIFDPKIFDGRIIVDENTVTMSRNASQNEYFHPNFHSALNRSIHYLGEKGGMACVRAYLTRYTRNVHKDLIQNIKEQGLEALEARWKEIYRKEKAEDVLTTRMEKSILSVEIQYCPAIKFLKSKGCSVSPWFQYIQETIMEVLASDGRLTFVKEAYDPETGAARYRFAV